VAHTIAFLKRESYTVLDLRGEEYGEHVSKQVQLINLGFIGEDFNIFELAATYVEYSLQPLFNSYRGTHGSASTGFENMQRDLTQLKVHLVQCQQNIIVPEIELTQDPEIKAKYEECKAQGREMTVDDFEQRLQDPNFIKRLEKTVTQWIKDIRRVTQLKHDPAQGSALQEINFWVSIERSLTQIEEHLKDRQIEVTLKLLSQAQKIQLVYHFQLDTELEQKLKTARDYNKLLRDFPINQLLSANDLESVRKAIDLIFNQFKYIKQSGVDSYPNQRAILLMNALTQDLNEQLLKILSDYQIMHLDYSEFDVLKKEIQNVFALLFEKINDFRNMINSNRSRLDQQSNKVMDGIMKNPLKERLERIFVFRKHHYKFRQIIKKTLSNEAPGDKNNNLEDVALSKINEAYQFFNGINVLDISKEGFDLWDQTERTYNLKIDKVESQITSILKAKLSQAQNANEMFRVFQIFNALFTRPRIRGAIQEYQIQLLIKVEKDIEVLRDKLLNN
jgi:dynein heavy chain 1